MMPKIAGTGPVHDAIVTSPEGVPSAGDDSTGSPRKVNKGGSGFKTQDRYEERPNGPSFLQPEQLGLSSDMDSVVIDLERSRNHTLVDRRTGDAYLDCAGGFGSMPLGLHRPEYAVPKYVRRLVRASLHKIASADYATQHLFAAVEKLRSLSVGLGMPKLYVADGRGSTAVEDALKACFDLRAKECGVLDRADWQVLHFENAFHGRGGYTLSLTNTQSQAKTRAFPQFDWPRRYAPALHQDSEDQIAKAEEDLKVAFKRYGDSLGCAIIEPIQCEGGDRHIPVRFLKKLRELCDAYNVPLVFDEVQTGMTAGPLMERPDPKQLWFRYTQLGVKPDIVVFAKRYQVSGFFAGPRFADAESSVFTEASRISSTFGPSQSDLVRLHKILEIVDTDGLLVRASDIGAYFLNGLHQLAQRYGVLSHPRGSGTLLAVDVAPELRDRVVSDARRNGLIILPCGVASVRFRPALDFQRDEVDTTIQTLSIVLKALPRTLPGSSRRTLV